MKYIILLCLLGILSHPLISQTTYYVSMDGNNALDGLAESRAFASITYAATQAQHGDTILVLSGTYTNASYDIIEVWSEERTVEIVNKEGSSGDYLVIKPREEDLVTLKGNGSFIFQIRNSSYIRIEGFQVLGESDSIPLSFAEAYQFTYRDSSGNELERVEPGLSDEEIDRTFFGAIENITRPTYFNTAGISVNASHHIDILNNTVSQMPGEGIRSFDSDFLNIIGNTVFECSGRSSTGVHGLSIYTLNSNIDPENSDVEGQRVLIARNKVYDNVNGLYSWSAKNDSITPHIDEGKGITVQRCTPENGWTRGIIRIENNICYGNGFSGIQVNSGERIEIVNNTCYENNASSEASEEADQHGISIQEGNDILIANNIIQADSTLNNGKALKLSPTSGDAVPVMIANNLILGKLNRKARNTAENTLRVLPLFQDESRKDFSLQMDSPARNAAHAEYAPEEDFFGRARDSLPDLGAIEFSDFPTRRKTYLSPGLRIFPNPVRHTLTIEGLPFGAEDVRIYNVLGQGYTAQVKVNGNTLRLETLPIGIYMLNIKGFVNKFYKL